MNDATVLAITHRPGREYAAEWAAQIDAVRYAAREQQRQLLAEDNPRAAAETIAAADHAIAALLGLSRTARQITGRVSHAVD